MLPVNVNETLRFDSCNLRDIYLAGGCFWGVEAYIERVLGVYRCEVGYCNGIKTDKTVTYDLVCSNEYNYVEVVYVKYDYTKINLSDLLEEFFKVVNPTTLNKQANDVGVQYRNGIYYSDYTDEMVINNFLKRLEKRLNTVVVTENLPVKNYFKAEESHQKYLEKNPNGYCHISF